MKPTSRLVSGIFRAMLLMLVFLVGLIAGMLLEERRGDGFPRAYVLVEQRRQLDWSMDASAFQRANRWIQDVINCEGESGVISCAISPRDSEWLRYTIYYVEPHLISGTVRAAVESLEPYPFRSPQPQAAVEK